ncbi:unnamed protein product [Closterium sp. NIES-53]
MYLMTCTLPDLAFPLSILARYVAPGRHQPEHWEAAKRVLRYLCSTSGMGLVLGGWGPVVLTGHADASWVDDLATQRSSQGCTFSLGSGSVSWRSTRSSSVLSSSCEAEIYARAMAAQELRWFTYLLTDSGEQPRSSPVLPCLSRPSLARPSPSRPVAARRWHVATRRGPALAAHGGFVLPFPARRWPVPARPSPSRPVAAHCRPFAARRWPIPVAALLSPSIAASALQPPCRDLCPEAALTRPCTAAAPVATLPCSRPCRGPVLLPPQSRPCLSRPLRPCPTAASVAASALQAPCRDLPLSSRR